MAKTILPTRHQPNQWLPQVDKTAAKPVLPRPPKTLLQARKSLKTHLLLIREQILLKAVEMLSIKDPEKTPQVKIVKKMILNMVPMTALNTAAIETTTTMATEGKVAATTVETLTKTGIMTGATTTDLVTTTALVAKTALPLILLATTIVAMAVVDLMTTVAGASTKSSTRTQSIQTQTTDCTTRTTQSSSAT